MRRTSSNAAPAAALSTIAWSRSEVASGGGCVDATSCRRVEREPDRPGQPHVPLVDVREQTELDQVGGRPGCSAPAPVGAGLGEVVEDRAGRCGEPLEQAG